MIILKSDISRNIVAFISDSLAFLLSIFTIIICVTVGTDKNAGYWWSVSISFILALICRMVASRLWVTRVCPQCSENRAIRRTDTLTGNVIRGAVQRSNFFYYQEVKEEHKIIYKCVYGCGYAQTEYVWHSKRETINR